MTIQSDDGRLTVFSTRFDGNGWLSVQALGLTAQQVYDALLPLLPPPVPTAREVAEALFQTRRPTSWDDVEQAMDLAHRWNDGGRP